MIGSCIAVATGLLVQVLPASTATLAWRHTVEHTLWEEDYAARGAMLQLVEARIHASGAGMDAGPGAWWADGAWHYVPALPPLEDVVLANSGFAGGYTLCFPAAACLPLARYAPPGQPVRITVRPCAREVLP